AGQDRRAALVQFTQVAQALFQRAQLGIVQAAGDFLAVAGNERHGGTFVEQRHGGGHLLGAHAQFVGDAGIDAVHVVTWVSRAMQAEPARKGGIKAAPGGQRQASRTAGNAWRSDWRRALAEKSANNAWQCIKGRCAIMRDIIFRGVSMTSSASLSEGEKILVVDDDARLRRLLERFLDEQGYRVRTVENVEQMDRLLARELFNLVVLDLMLPGEDGLSACRRLREGNNQVPIIMLTAKGDEGSRIQGLEGGADDYLAKPFNPRELLARIKAVLRRQTPLVPGAPGSEDESVSFGDYELSLATRELKKGDEVQMLTTGEFAVLKALVQHAREPLTRDKLMNLARGREWDALERSIDVQISRLRRLIEPDPSKPRYIQTVWGVGYVFVPDGTK